MSLLTPCEKRNVPSKTPPQSEQKITKLPARRVFFSGCLMLLVFSHHETSSLSRHRNLASGVLVARTFESHLLPLCGILFLAEGLGGDFLPVFCGRACATSGYPRTYLERIPRASPCHHGLNLLSSTHHNANLRSRKGNLDVEQLSHVYHVTTNAHSSQGESQLYIF